MNCTTQMALYEARTFLEAALNLLQDLISDDPTKFEDQVMTLVIHANERLKTATGERDDLAA